MVPGYFAGYKPGLFLTTPSVAAFYCAASVKCVSLSQLNSKLGVDGISIHIY